MGCNANCLLSLSGFILLVIFKATEKITMPLFRVATRKIPFHCHGRRFSIAKSSSSIDFHQLDNVNFTERMRKNLVDRNSDVDFNNLLSIYRRFQNGEKDLRPKLERLFLSLPNFSHPDTPVGDPSKYRLIYRHGSPKSIPQPRNEVELLSNGVVSHMPRKQGHQTGLGVLGAPRSIVGGCGPRSYAFFGSLARLESALIQLTLDRTRRAGFRLVVVPDVLPASVIECCGFPTSGERNQIFKIGRMSADDPAVGQQYCLSGTAEMGLAGFCADNVFGGGGADAEFLCAVSRCYRREISPQESLLYRTHQFTKVEIFCVARPSREAGDRTFDKIIDFQSRLYSDLELHFRVLEIPTSELGNPAHRKVDIEALMPGEGMYGEISSTSNCTDYQAARLNIRWKEDDVAEVNPFAYTLNGTGCAATRILKALVETHQNTDGSINLPRVLWPYMNGIQKLQMEESPLMMY
uniref:serine--tRNA ligase n=1 Tax=Mesocestoides corti TaxID=53468 RepID=A0A5K3EPY1_MESCO